MLLNIDCSAKTTLLAILIVCKYICYYFYKNSVATVLADSNSRIDPQSYALPLLEWLATQNVKYLFL